MFNLPSFRSKSQPELDGLHNLKTLTRWINSLPGGDVYGMQDQIVRKLAEFNRQKSQPDQTRFDMLLYLDEYARPLQATLCQQYLRNPRMSHGIENRLWHTIYQFYWEVARAYYAFILSYIAAPVNHPMKALMPQITLRALHNFGNVFKWHYFRYEKPKAKFWLRLHNLYQIAECEGYAKTELSLYPQDNMPTRCVDQYTRILLLTQLETSALYPKQTEMADQWLNQWSRHVEPDRKFNADTHTFYVSLADGIGARRVRNQDYSESCRFMAASGLHHKINQIHQALQHGSLPAQLGLGQESRLPECLELLEYAERQWNPIHRREQRKSPRIPSKKMVDVAHGFNAVCALIKQQDDKNADARPQVDTELQYEEMIDMKLYGFVTDSTRIRHRPAAPSRSAKTAPHERWIMADESEHGLSANVPAEANDWIRLDSLVSIQSERGAQWKIGVVRRLVRSGDGLCQVGIEILSQHPRIVLTCSSSVHESQAYSVAEADSALPVPVLLIHRNNSQCEFVLEAAQYASGRSLQIFDAPGDVIRLCDVVEKGDGWLRVTADIAHAGAKQ